MRVRRYKQAGDHYGRIVARHGRCHCYCLHGFGTGDDRFRIFQTVHVLPITLAKLSILFFYRRIFRGPVFNAVTWATIVLASVWGVAFFFSILFECTPIDLSLILPPVAPQIHCIDQTANFWGLSISDVLIDVIILCTPFPFVWNLQMSTKHKWGVSGMFLLGALYVSTHAQKEKLADLTLRRTIAASIARLVVFINAGTLLAQNDPDFTCTCLPSALLFPPPPNPRKYPLTLPRLRRPNRLRRSPRVFSRHNIRLSPRTPPALLNRHLLVRAALSTERIQSPLQHLSLAQPRSLWCQKSVSIAIRSSAERLDQAR